MRNQIIGNSIEGTSLHTRSDGKLYNIARLKAKTKICRVLICLFAEQRRTDCKNLQHLMYHFSKTFDDFQVSVWLRIWASQDADLLSSITINNYQLKTLKVFSYLGSTVADSHDMKPELDRCIGLATSTFARFAPRMWKNRKWTLKTNMASVLSMLLYDSKSWKHQ